jgi:CheY-like chemotaxis protein/anti-sigma regulatory factor (Ser/Thr protein kinase)
LLPDFIAHLAAMLRPQAAEKALIFDVQNVGRLPRIVRSDEKCMRQILINLIGNAIRFTSTGSVTLRVSHAWDTVTFEIIDTGPGIATADIERLFMPFERGQAARDYDRGAGLGLTICQLLTQALGGSLEVDSEPGRGTRFVVKLFAPEVHGVEDARVTTGGISGYRGARRTVLVVDDLPDQRSIVSQVLAPLGFTVAEAGSGPDALRWLGIHAADAIIMDISMPDMDGYETSRLIRGSQLSRAPIMLLSANAFADDRERATAIGCDDYLVKPLQVALLLEKLARLLQIEWIVTHENAAAPMPALAPPAVARVRAILPRALRDALGALLEMGYVQGIVEQLDKAALQWPQLADELAHELASLRALAQRFELTEFARQLALLSGDSDG